LRAAAASPTLSAKIFNPAGSVRLVGWDKDSIVVRGRVARGERFQFALDGNGARLGVVDAKLGILDRGADETAGACTFVIYFPKHGSVSVKTVTASITASDVSGWFYSVSGAIHLAGTATRAEVESMRGDVALDLVTPWVHGRTGDGHLLLRGAPQDADVSTVAGTLDVAAPSLLRGQFGSVSGDIHYAGKPARGAIFEFSNHSGSVDLAMPSTVSGVFALSSIGGAIENGFTEVRPIASAPHSLRLSLGRGEAQVTVRTFKGAIRLRPAS